MARYTKSSCRVCRRRGTKLFLKGLRCNTDKCSYDKRSYVPGQHGKGKSARSKISDYGLQLREKQKVKKIYGLLERQFRRYFNIASQSKGVTGKKLLELLERRLDNVVFRACFAFSRPHARQMVGHGNIFVNSKRVNIPSYWVKPGDIVNVRQKEKIIKRLKETIESVKDKPIPKWLDVDFDVLKVRVARLPERDDIDRDIQEQLIVELYSK